MNGWMNGWMDGTVCYAAEIRKTCSVIVSPGWKLAETTGSRGFYPDIADSFCSEVGRLSTVF